MKMIDRLVNRMEGKNLSEIARRAGVARDHITDISRGRIKNMKVVTYEKLTAVLDDMEKPYVGVCTQCLYLVPAHTKECNFCGGVDISIHGEEE